MIEKLRQIGFRVSENDIVIINNWAYKNGLSNGYVMRRSLKDFIRNYIDKNIMPPTEELNKGCIITSNVI